MKRTRVAGDEWVDEKTEEFTLQLAKVMKADRAVGRVTVRGNKISFNFSPTILSSIPLVLKVQEFGFLPDEGDPHYESLNGDIYSEENSTFRLPGGFTRTRDPREMWKRGKANLVDIFRRAMTGSDRTNCRRDTMNRESVARELVAISKFLAGHEIEAWEGVRQDVDIGKRNSEVNRSLSSYAPRISAIMRKSVSAGLRRMDFDVDPRDLKLEWSSYLAYIDPVANANKYHYYVVYSFETIGGETLYVGWNCSGRIGIIERAYDLTDKYLGGPVTSLTKAVAACEKHLRSKLSKGYERMKMVRG